MTDKEIIIDGVDVAGCEYYQIEANELYPKAQYCGSMRNTFCENEPNCYYKRLKRLEFENKLIKADYEASEQENAELKAEYKRLKQEWRLDCLKCEYKNTKAAVDKYRQTLQVIKGIAEIIDTAECRERRKNARKIIDLITKAEEE